MTFSRTRHSAGFVAAALVTLGIAPAWAQQLPAGHSANDGHNHGAPPKPAAAAAPKAPAVKLPTNIVARVNNQNITSSEVLSLLHSFGGQPLVQQMVQSAVIEQEARRLGVSVANAEIEKEVKATKERLVQQAMMQGTPMSFSEIAARDGITEPLIRWSLRRNLLTRKAFGKSIEKNVATLDQRIKVSHILIATVPLPDSPQQEVKEQTPEEQKTRDEAARKKIDGIQADIKAGKMTFADAAKQFSDDKGSGARGGELDYYAKGQLDPAFEQAAWALKDKASIAGPVKSQYGYHIIRLIGMGKDAPATEKAAFKKLQLDQQMGNPQAIQGWVAGLMSKAKITLNPKAQIAPASKGAPRKASATR